MGKHVIYNATDHAVSFVVLQAAGNGTSPQKRTGTVDEGYLLQVSPLFSTDGRSVDVDIRCRVRQVERLVPVMVESPRGTTGPTRLQIQVPQMSQWQFERTVSLGKRSIVIDQLRRGGNSRMGPSIYSWYAQSLWLRAPVRANALIFIECRGTPQQALLKPAKTAGRPESAIPRPLLKLLPGFFNQGSIASRRRVICLLQCTLGRGTRINLRWVRSSKSSAVSQFPTVSIPQLAHFNSPSLILN